MEILISKFLKRAIFLMAPFLFIACEKPNNELGFNQVIGSVAGLDVIEYDSIITYTQGIDSLLVATDETQVSFGGYTGSRLVGSITDGHFGKTKASFITEVLLSDIDPDFRTNPIVDSVVLYLRYSGAYGDTSIPMNLEVYELEGAVRPNGVVLDSDSNEVDSAYYSNYEPILASSPNLLGSKTFVPRPGVNIRVENVLRGPTLKMNLDVNFFQTNFADVGDGNNIDLASNSAFIQYFRGLYVTTTTLNGAILYFDLNTSNSEIKIYFHNDEDPAAQSVTLDFTQEGDIQPIGFNIFDNDYSGTYPVDFNLSTINTDKGESVTYVQAMSGLTTVVEIPGLEDLANEDILINNAYLEVRKQRGTGLSLAPPPTLEIREFSSRGPASTIKDFATGTGGGGFVAEEIRDGYYRFNITKYVFEVVNSGQTQKLAIVPVSKSVVADRVILQGGFGVNDPVRLKVYYTKP